MDVHFPRQPEPYNVNISSSAKNLIRKLLCKDDEQRLGSRAGAVDVRQHAFFKNINFALLRNMTPPILPALQKPNGIDAINFRKIQESISLDLEADGLKTITTVEKTNPFEKFDSRKFTPHNNNIFFLIFIMLPQLHCIMTVIQKQNNYITHTKYIPSFTAQIISLSFFFFYTP